MISEVLRLGPTSNMTGLETYEGIDPTDNQAIDKSIHKKSKQQQQTRSSCRVPKSKRGLAFKWSVMMRLAGNLREWHQITFINPVVLGHASCKSSTLGEWMLLTGMVGWDGTMMSIFFLKTIRNDMTVYLFGTKGCINRTPSIFTSPIWWWGRRNYPGTLGRQLPFFFFLMKKPLY